MSAEKSGQTAKKKSKKRFIKWLLAVVCLIVVVFLLVPVFVSSGAGHRLILGRINKSLAGEADFADLSVGWWRGVTVEEFSFKDDSERTSVTIKEIYTKPHYGSLLLGNLSFGETRLEEPRIDIRLAEGRRAGGEDSVEVEVETVVLPVARMDLNVVNGNLRVTDEAGQSAEVSRVNSELKLRPAGETTEFKVDMLLQGAKVESKGWVEPKKRTGWSLKGTSGGLAVKVEDLSLGSLEPLLALAGIDIEAEGRLSVDMVVKVRDGGVEDFSGSINGRGIEIGGELLRGDRLRTGTLSVHAKGKQEDGRVRVSDLLVDTSWLDAEVRGVVPVTFESLAVFLEPGSGYSLEGSFECNVAEAMSQMPALLGVKEGVKVTSGKLTGKVKTIEKEGKKLLSGDAELAGLAGVMEEKEIRLSEPVTAAVEIFSDANVVTFDRLDVSAPFGKVTCRGTSELLKYEEQMDLGKLQSELGQFLQMGGYEMTGAYSGEGEISLGKERIRINGTSLVKDFSLRSAEGASATEAKADMEFSVGMEREGSVLGIEHIGASGSFGQINVKDGIVPLGEKVSEGLKLDIAAKGIDLAKVGSFGAVLGYVDPNVRLGGIAESEVSVRMEDGAYRLRTDSTSIKGLKIEYPQKKPFEQEQVSVVFDATVNPSDKTIAVHKLELTSPQIKIEGNFEESVEGERTKLKGKAELEYDWAAVGTLAAGYLPAGLKLEGQRKDSISFSSEYAKGRREELLSNLNASGKVGFDKASFMGLAFGATEVPVEVNRGVLGIAGFSTTVNNGHLRLGGEADFSGEPVLFKTAEPIHIAEDIEITKELGSELLMYLNPLFAGFSEISGVVDFNCTELSIPLGGASKEELVVSGTLSMERLRLEGSGFLAAIFALMGRGVPAQDFALHPMEFEVRDGLVRYEDMELVVGANPLNFSGVIGLDHSIKDMTVTLPYTLSGETVRVGKAFAGQRISVPIGGTLESPQIDTGKLLEQQLKGRLEQELKKKVFEGLDELFK